MNREHTPSSVSGWLKEIRINGVSSRPFPLDQSDLRSPGFYGDPMEIKPERTALTAIVSIRAYSEARKVMKARRARLEIPSIAEIKQSDNPYVDLIAKSDGIGKAFTVALVDSLLLDELKIKSLPADIVSNVYSRLEDILKPHREHFPRDMEIKNTDRIIQNPSAAFCDVYVGWEALNTNISALLRNSTLLYYKQFNHLPTVETVLEITRNSFDSFIVPLASFHKADALFLLREIAEELEKKGETVVELHEKTVRIRPDILERVRTYRTALKDNRSKTTRCAFLTPNDEIEAFLDEPVDFDNPLRDAFDIHMELLAA